MKKKIAKKGSSGQYTRAEQKTDILSAIQKIQPS